MVQYDWMRAEKASPEPSLEGGSSGFFTPPSQHLDPDLFDGLTMRPEGLGKDEWLSAKKPEAAGAEEKKEKKEKKPKKEEKK